MVILSMKFDVTYSFSVYFLVIFLFKHSDHLVSVKEKAILTSTYKQYFNTTIRGSFSKIKFNQYLHFGHRLINYQNIF